MQIVLHFPEVIAMCIFYLEQLLFALYSTITSGIITLSFFKGPTSRSGGFGQSPKELKMQYPVFYDKLYT